MELLHVRKPPLLLPSSLVEMTTPPFLTPSKVLAISLLTLQLSCVCYFFLVALLGRFSNNALGACLDVAVDVDVVVGLLGQIVVVLKGLLVNLTFILNNPVGFVLTLQGKIITVQQLGVIVYTLLAVSRLLSISCNSHPYTIIPQTVITVLALVVRVVNITVHGVVGTLVAEIG